MEEQFYLVLPAVAFWLLRARAQAFHGLVALIAVITSRADNDIGCCIVTTMTFS